MVNLVEHELARDGRLGAVHLGGATLKRRNHLLHHLVEEDVSELGVEEGAKLEGDLRRGGRMKLAAEYHAVYIRQRSVCVSVKLIQLEIHLKLQRYLQQNPQCRYEDNPGGQG